MKLSTALANFLKKKRTIEIQPAPEIEASHSTYLEEFSTSVKQRIGAQKQEKERDDGASESDEDEKGTAMDKEESNDLGEKEKGKGMGLSSSSSGIGARMDSGDAEDGELDIENEVDSSIKRVKELEADPDIMCIRLFNLPYRLTGESDLIYFCEDLDIDCEESKFDYNDAGEFSGSGRVWVRLGDRKSVV